MSSQEMHQYDAFHHHALVAQAEDHKDDDGRDHIIADYAIGEHVIDDPVIVHHIIVEHAIDNHFIVDFVIVDLVDHDIDDHFVDGSDHGIPKLDEWVDADIVEYDIGISTSRPGRKQKAEEREGQVLRLVFPPGLRGTGVLQRRLQHGHPTGQPRGRRYMEGHRGDRGADDGAGRQNGRGPARGSVDLMNNMPSFVQSPATALPLKTNVEVPEDWAWAILTCHTTDHRPLRFCRFLRPDGTPLILDEVGLGPGLNLEAGVGYGRFQYHGNGMSTGDCGVTLTNVLDSDAGEWLCVVGVSGEAGQQRGELTLRPPPPNLPGGLSLGAMMGIGLVCAFVLFVVVHEVIERRVTWREKRTVRKRSEKAFKDTLGSNQNPSIVGKF
ncbi:uncharacterized protein [Hetaerina americana]|uniref:uncharacterized protein n=1 Tax=Hetaerina americana TaxID=62018 RepID=UPI003A7F1672